MLKTWQYVTLIALGAVSLMLVVTNASLFASNRAQQGEINQRQVFLQQTQSLDGLYRDMVKGLAELAVRSNDRRVIDALAAQGINVTPNQPAVATADTGSKK
ncbi:hypothetical protein [Aquabacterium sp.]|uniref:hypothetical protein n=1 Tax=Aquabacterium sp. TaxID=1872578 RepID=UPI002BDAF7AA|nr:hypothetical protein [Aquabacterium sp.]HSW08492.1 hypothetical protein [Aquabacterium sp.]